MLGCQKIFQQMYAPSCRLFSPSKKYSGRGKIKNIAFGSKHRPASARIMAPSFQFYLYVLVILIQFLLRSRFQFRTDTCQNFLIVGTDYFRVISHFFFFFIMLQSSLRDRHASIAISKRDEIAPLLFSNLFVRDGILEIESVRNL